MVDAAELADVLRRAVGRVCPSWLASQREDLVQSACLRVLKIWSEAEESRPLEASYLWRVAHSVVMDEIRRRRRRPEVALGNPGVAEPAAQEAGPDQRHAAASLRGAIDEGLRQLSDPRRQAVLLYLHGFSLQDSARVLGWTAKRVDNQRYQGLSQLRAYLRERGLEP